MASSYRSVAGFDDSQGAGVTAFKARTNLGPTDFSFLLGLLFKTSLWGRF